MSRIPAILLIDDERSVYEDLRTTFQSKYTLFYASSADTALARLKDNYKFDAILLDLELDPRKQKEKEGLLLLPILRDLLPQTPIIVVTKYNSTNNVVEAIKLGATDFFYKEDRDASKWSSEINRYIKLSKESKNTEIVQEKHKQPPVKKANSFFVGESEAIEKIKNILLKLSNKPNITILLTGETGVGKEVAAKYLHAHGARKNKPFQPVHLSAITETTMESRLFGHKKGSFTDAKEDSRGLFEEANGGVLFLDEIGEINPDIQIKLLRFLENKIIRPVGGDKEIRLDIQIVAATNRKLKAEVEKGNFRKDLYYRLNQFQVILPPLRERPKDIELLLAYYLDKAGDNPDIITGNVRQFLLSYSWPGNIRELVNWVRSAALKRDILELDKIDDTLLSEDMQQELQYGIQGSAVERAAKQPSSEEDNTILPLANKRSPKEQMYANSAIAELQAIEQALIETNGRKGDAAKLLGKSDDNIRYLVEKHHKNMPNLFTQFPMISKRYKFS